MKSNTSFYKIICLSIFLFISNYINGQLIWDWVKSNEFSSGSIVNDILIKDEESIFLTGSFSGRVTFGNITLETQLITESFITMINKNGNIKWVKKIIANNNNESFALITDSLSIYVVGCWYEGERNFIAKLDLNGNQEWIKIFGESQIHAELEKGKNCYFKNKIVIASKSNIHIFDKEGNIIKEINWSAASITCDENFIYALHGAHITIFNENLEQIGGIDFIDPLALFGMDFQIKALQLKGDFFYATGVYNNEFTIGDSTYSSIKEMFIIKMDKKGKIIFSNHGGRSVSTPYDFKLNSSSDICVVGFYNHIGIFDSLSVGYSGASEQIFVAQYDGENGKLKTLNSAGSQGIDHCYGIDIDKEDNIYVTGSIQNWEKNEVSFDDLSVRIALGNYTYFFGKLIKSTRNASISGTLLANNSPILGEVELYKLGMDSTVYLVYRNITSEDGKYNISLYRDGNYYLWCNKNDNQLVSTYYKNEFLWENASPLSINSDSILENKDISIIELPILNGDHTISGTLFNEFDSLLSFFDIYLISGKDSVISYCRTDSVGNYNFTLIPDGEYQIYVDKIGMLMDSIYTINTGQKSTYSDYNYIIDYSNRRIKIANNQSTNINELNDNVDTYKIYPNPAIDYLNIVTQKEDFKSLNYIVIDNSGKIVKIINKNTSRKIDISELKTGFYLLLINSGINYQIKKFIKN
jgi:hypothetical protein